jgi:hypothetical protein
LVNGGTPVRGSISQHGALIEAGLAVNSTSPDFDGYFVLDWEQWMPQWENAGHTPVLRDLALTQIATDYPSLNQQEVETLTQQLWEERGLAYFLETVRALRRARPKAKITWYELINRVYWDSYSSPNGNELRRINNELLPVFRELDLLVISLYQFYSSAQDGSGWPLPFPSPYIPPPNGVTYFEHNRRYVADNVGEARRLAMLAGGKKVMAYAWPRYHDSASPADRYRLNRKGEIFLQLLYPLLLGADLVTLWGSESPALASAGYGSMQDYLNSTLGPMTEAYCAENLSSIQPVVDLLN